MFHVSSIYHYAEFRYAECCYAECRYAGCCNAECRGAFKAIIQIASKDIFNKMDP